MTARKKWIAGSLEPRGTLTIDAGAVAALRNGRSLLPAGVIRIDGAFERGDAVMMRGPDGAEVGRGLVAYDAEDADKIIGRSSADIISILGFGGRAEMIHRDDLVVGQGDRSGGRAVGAKRGLLPEEAFAEDRREDRGSGPAWRGRRPEEAGRIARFAQDEDPGAREGPGSQLPDG